jgi:hypothetical protein
METMTDLTSIGFGLLLAALAVAPNLIGIWVERRTRKKGGAPPSGCKVLTPYPPPVPFNYPPLGLHERPKGLDAEGIDDADPADWWKGEKGQGA